MAAEIPVIVDIFGAFKEAAKNIQPAISPLESAIEAHPLGMSITVDIGGASKKLSDLFANANTSAKQFKLALTQVEERINSMAVKGGFSLRNAELKVEEASLLDAAGALEQALGRVSNSASMMGRVLRINMQQAEADLARYSQSLNFLTKQQNFTAKDSNLYATRAKKIDAVNAKIAETRSYLAACSIELDKITRGSERAGVAVRQMATPAQAMAASWRAGHEALMRYNASLTTTNSRMATLLKSGLRLVALHSAINLVRNIREVTAEFEMQRVALAGIIQDTDKAEDLFKQIKVAAVQSPFEIKDLVSFTKQLSAYRIETDKLFDVTMRLADVSAGLGVDMRRLVLAYGQVRAASVLRGQELRQFTEAGIPLVDLLAEKFSELRGEVVSTGEVFKLISARAVPFKMVEEIFNDMTNAGGIFYKMQERQSETLKGQWMKLKDAAAIMYDEIGNTSAVHKGMTDLLSVFMSLLQNWRQVGGVIGLAVTGLVAYKVALKQAAVAANALTLREAASLSAMEVNVVQRSKLIASIFGEVAATRVQVAVGNAYIRMKKRELIATNLLTKAYYRAAAALLANPYAAAAAAIAVLVAGIIRLIRHTRQATITNDEFQKSIAQYNKAKGRVNEIDELCDAYDKLNAQTDRTAKEEERLRRVTRELGKAYPQAVDGVDEHTRRLKINTEAIRENNAETRELIRLAFEQDKKAAEKQIAKLEKEREHILEKSRAGGWYNPSVGGIVPWSEKEQSDFGKRLLEIDKQLAEYGASVREADSALKDFKQTNEDFYDVPPPPFLGDAWKNDLANAINRAKEAGTTVLSTINDQLEGYSDQSDAVDDLIKLYKKLVDQEKFYKNEVEATTGSLNEQATANLLNIQTGMNSIEALMTSWGAYKMLIDAINKGNKQPRASYQQDPFVELMKDRMKFMQDFQKGVQNLEKYMSSSQALGKESEIMLNRGLSLGIDTQEQARAAIELSQWYTDAMQEAFSKAQKYGAGKDLNAFLSRQISGKTDRDKTLKAFQNLIQSLFDAKTDFDTSQLEKNINDSLDKLSADIKYSETARNFYNEILAATGDQDIALNLTTSIYGNPGKEFKDRVQEEMAGALSSVKDLLPPGVFDEFMGDVTVFDIDELKKRFNELPETIQPIFKRLFDEIEKDNSDFWKNFYKEFANARDAGAKIKQLQAQMKQAVLAASARGASTDQIADIQAKYDADIAAVRWDDLRGSDEWVKAFEGLEKVGSATIESLITKAEEFKKSADFELLTPEEQKQLVRFLEQLRDEKTFRNPYGALIGSLREYIKAQKDLNAAEKEGGKDSANYKAAQNKARAALAKMQKSVDGISDSFNSLSSIASSLGDMLDLDEYDGFSVVLDSVAESLGLVGSALTFIQSILTLMETNPIVLSITAAIAAVVTLTKVFANLKTAKANREIEKQQKVIEALERSYGRLEKAIEDAFGSDYVSIYNQQMDALLAEREAIEKQLAYAQSKPNKTKKQDKERAEQLASLQDDLDAVSDKISDLTKEYDNFIAGTDVTSAARSFAEAWIEAYRSFSSTTAAMKDNFKEMIDNMVTSSLAAGIVQSILDPIFKDIEAYAQAGGFDEAAIADIAGQTSAAVTTIDEAMRALMQRLSAAGINMRATGSEMSGISKDIASASEESILGLAAGINTQNYYMSFVPTISQNVASILTLMGGSAASGEAGTVLPGAASTFGDEIFRGQMSRIDENISEIRYLLKSVITPKQAATNTHAVAIK